MATHTTYRPTAHHSATTTQRHHDTTKIESQNDPLEAIVENTGVKVHEQPDTQIQRLEVRQHLRPMNRTKPRHRLQFYQHFPTDDEIHLLARYAPVPVT